ASEAGSAGETSSDRLAPGEESGDNALFQEKSGKQRVSPLQVKPIFYNQASAGTIRGERGWADTGLTCRNWAGSSPICRQRRRRSARRTSGCAKPSCPRWATRTSRKPARTSRRAGSTAPASWPRRPTRSPDCCGPPRSTTPNSKKKCPSSSRPTPRRCRTAPPRTARSCRRSRGRNEHARLRRPGIRPGPGRAGEDHRLGGPLSQSGRITGGSPRSAPPHRQLRRAVAGKAAEAFRGTVNDLPDLLDRGQRSLRAAGEALHGWQADLEVMQRQAAELESRAEAAKKRAERAERNPDLGLAGQEFPDEQSLRNAQARLDAAVAELNAARNEVAEILEQAKRLHAQHTEIAEEVARALRKAQELAPDEPGLLERIGSELGELLGDSIEAIGDALGELASGAWQL